MPVQTLQLEPNVVKTSNSFTGLDVDDANCVQTHADADGDISNKFAVCDNPLFAAHDNPLFVAD